MTRLSHRSGKARKGVYPSLSKPLVFVEGYQRPVFHSTRNLMQSGSRRGQGGMSVTNLRSGAVSKNVRPPNTRATRYEKVLTHSIRDDRKGYAIALDRDTFLDTDGIARKGKVVRKQKRLSR